MDRSAHTSGLTRLHALSALMGGLALVLTLGPLRGLAPIAGGPFELQLVVLTLGFIVAESLAVTLETREEAHQLNFVEVVYALGLVLAAPDTMVAARVLGGFVVLGVLKRQSIHKLIANVTMFALEAATCALVFRLFPGSGSPVTVMGWLAVFVAILAGYTVSSVGATLAIATLTGWPGRQVLVHVFGIGGLLAFANAAIGLGLAGALWEGSLSGVLFAAVVLVLFALNRAFTRLKERHRDLETLHEFTRRLGDQLEIEALEVAITSGVRDILRAEHAALLLPPAWSGLPATRVVERGGEIFRGHMTEAELAADLDRLLVNGEGRLLGPGEPLPGWMADIGVKDAICVPLVSDGGATGAAIAINRLTEFNAFKEEDLVVFGTLARHASVGLTNGRLVATLQHDAQEKAHQALHDPVTDLPNRSSLEETLRVALAEAHRTEKKVGLIFVDLDTFKEVNDTLGIATGDQVLREVRDRLSPLLPDRSILTRFTGDQFALMVQGVRDPEEVEGLAELIDAEFDQPFVTGEASIVMAASIGVALYPDHATTADLLVQRADAATYLARKEGSGIEVYAPETDPQSQRRMSLATDLRIALEQGEVDVYLQPKLSLGDSMVVGAEALVRWTHPRLGPLDPDEFIGAAEQTGVIRSLTPYVLREALQQCRAWRDAGLDLGISVNLSVKNLFEPRLADDIGAAIEAAGVPASCLTLEITESTVMESRRSVEVLAALDALGLTLSIDDFGTGYSSLTYLRQLPVRELKIDKSFVMTMTTSDQDAVIVRTLVELGRSLGLKTVAEGVESPEAVRMLDEYGCIEAQGYLFSRPIPAEQFTAWLARQNVKRLNAGVVSFERERERRASGDISQG